MKLRKNKNKSLIKKAICYMPWDYGFNLEIEKDMFNRMYVYFSSDSPVVCGAKILAERAKLAVSLLNIIMEEDSALIYKNGKWHLNKYINTKNCYRYNIISDCDILIDDLRIEKAWYLYNKLRYYFMRQLWD